MPNSPSSDRMSLKSAIPDKNQKDISPFKEILCQEEGKWSVMQAEENEGGGQILTLCLLLCARKKTT